MHSFSTSRYAAMLSAMFLATAAFAGEAPTQLRVCISDIPFAPYTNPEGTGHLQYLIKQAAKSLKVELDMHIAPHKRCQAEVRNGVADGTIGVVTQERLSYAEFPSAGGKADERKALVKVRVSVYRRVGTNLDWDGKRFSGLGDETIGIQSGFAYTETLKQLGVRYDDSAKSVEQNMEKLALGRVAGMLMMDVESDLKILERYAGRIERIGVPFNDQTVIFLFVAKPFYARFPGFVEAYWDAIKSHRESPEYLRYQQRAF